MLYILLGVVEAHLRQTSGAANSARPRLGAVSFILRFASSLNRHVHYHFGVINGVFEHTDVPADYGEAVRFRPTAALVLDAVDAITEPARIRVLRWFARSGLIEPDDVHDMVAGDNGGRPHTRSRRAASG